MAIQVNKIFHANVYVDGTAEQIGRANEVTLPMIEWEMSEHKAMGMFGALELPAGLKALVATFKWQGFYADLAKFGANPFLARAIQVRANLEVYGADGREEQQPLVCSLRGTFKKLSGGALKPQEAASGYDDEMAISYYKLEVNGEELYEIDVYNNILRVDGVDLLAEMKANLGTA